MGQFSWLGAGQMPLRLDLRLRARRVTRTLAALPRRLSHGPVILDLLDREGWVGRHRLGLHPREFALLWRLAETPGVPVAPDTLLNEVWHLSHRPETNSLAVHVCRLRAKLAVAGLPHLLYTSPGGYVLQPPAATEAVEDFADNSDDEPSLDAGHGSIRRLAPEPAAAT